MRLHAAMTLISLASVSVGGGLACSPKSASGGPTAGAPAKVVLEGDLNKITLTGAAQTRLGLKILAVEKRRVDRSRELGGELRVPPGLSITVSAPFAGTIAGVAALRAGEPVQSGQSLFGLEPMLSAGELVSLLESRVKAAGEVEKAKIELEAATVAHERARNLLRDGSGSQRDVDETAARLGKARAELAATEAHTKWLEGVASSPSVSSSTPIRVDSPLDGVVLDLHVSPGQAVSAGMPLFEVAAIERLWVRVPVYAGDVSGIDSARSVQVGRLGATTGRQGGAPRGPESRSATPVAAPPSADPAAFTVDLFYELDNTDRSFRPGERVRVRLPLRGEDEALLVPWSAVIYDVHGGTWVYEETAPRTFVRRRVQVREVRGDAALLAPPGPAVGTRVVSEGAAELFGTEFGVGK